MILLLLAGHKAIWLGGITDSSLMAEVYGASDLFIAPSREENLANTVLEAMACGVPCVAFRIGGMPDTIMHKENGFLAKPFDTKELAAGVEWVLADSTRHIRLSQISRQTVMEKNSMTKSIDSYIELYQELIDLS